MGLINAAVSHDRCISLTDDAVATLPTRLLDTRFDFQDPIRLVQSTSLPSSSRFATQVTAAGTSTLLRLLQKLVLAYMEEIPISQLPKTFSEAIHERLMAAFDSTVLEEELCENFDEHDGYAIEIV